MAGVITQERRTKLTRCSQSNIKREIGWASKEARGRFFDAVCNGSTQPHDLVEIGMKKNTDLVAARIKEFL